MRTWVFIFGSCLLGGSFLLSCGDEPADGPAAAGEAGSAGHGGEAAGGTPARPAGGASAGAAGGAPGAGAGGEAGDPSQGGGAFTGGTTGEGGATGGASSGSGGAAGTGATPEGGAGGAGGSLVEGGAGGAGGSLVEGGAGGAGGSLVEGGAGGASDAGCIEVSTAEGEPWAVDLTPDNALYSSMMAPNLVAPNFADYLALVFYDNATGSFALGEGVDADATTCGRCFIAYVDLLADTTLSFFADSGTLTISPASSPLTGSLDVVATDVRLIQMQYDETSQVSVPVPGGACLHVQSMHIVYPPG